MHFIFLALLLGVLVEATPQRKPFCSKVASRSCKPAATRYCHSFLGHTTETEYLPATATQTEYVYTQTTYTLQTDHPCFGAAPMRKRDEPLPAEIETREAVDNASPDHPEHLAAQVEARAAAAVVNARAPVDSPTQPAANLAPRATLPQCLKPWSGEVTAMSSACSCIATGIPTKTSQLPDETQTIEATKTQVVQNFRIFRGYDRYLKSVGQQQLQYAPFVCPDCEGVAVFTLDAFSELGNCALINDYGQHGWVINNQNHLVAFMNPGTASQQSEFNGLELSSVLCRVYTDYDNQLMCESTYGMYDKTYLTADEQQMWQMDNTGNDEILLFAEPWPNAEA